MRFLSLTSATFALAGAAVAAPAHQNNKRSIVERDGINHTIFEHAATGAKLDYVTNSGICETTAGVNQYSGYLSVGSNMNMWFWFFEARSSPSTAPFATWFNGGPGCSSMIGLFQENGPCHFVNGESDPSLNEYSFNSYANMLYVDQPIGTGFSYGTDDVDSTVTAAPYVWKLLQAFYSAFPQYENREFGIFTESYGGHYGPEFATYFESQNSAIASGSVSGEKIDLIALGINNGWIDPLIQEKAYVTFSYNNTYKQLIDQSDYNSYMDSYNNDCAPAIKQCASSGSDDDCSNAENTCGEEIEDPLIDAADFDVYDVREPSNDPYPPDTYVSYLQQSSIQKAIGAKQKYQECPDAPGNKFTTTGDDSRSFLSQLGSVVSSGVTTLIWHGDADWICNWFGGQTAANSVSYADHSTFASASLTPYTVNGNHSGDFKTAGGLSFLRVFEAGHEVPYYQPKLALQVFKQTMQKQAISST